MLVVLLAGGMGHATAQDRAAGPIPEPPRRRDAWTPPATKLPPALVESATKLFDLGLADPRGGEYRTFEVAEWLPEGGWPTLPRRRGWVFPAQGGAAGRFAVGWDGLLYPATKVGEPADLAAGPPAETLRPDAIQVCLLLRLGRADEAERAWAKLLGPAGGRGVDVASNVYGYDQLVREFSWSLYVRATAAFGRGDDGLALHDARLLTRLARDYDRDATARRVPRPQLAGAARPGPYLEYLDHLPELLADLERRASEPPRPPVPAAGRGDRSARVAALIRDLDRVGPDRSDRDGSMNPFRNPTLLALAAEGDAAVGPLIEALRRDDRLTRVLREGRHRVDPVGVAELALDALTMTLKSADFGEGPATIDRASRRPEDRRALADRVQTYWDRRKDRGVAERWYLSLRDDPAGEREWQGAARQIVAVEPARPWTGDLPAVGRPVPPARLQGESLRAGHDPTVADLLNRRATGLIADVYANPRAASSIAVAWMADSALAWDPVAAQPTLREAARLFRAEFDTAAGPDQASRRSLLLVQSARYVVPRVRAGDHAAATEYAALLRRADPRKLDATLAEVLAPLHRLPDEPALAEVADWMFNDPGSPWAKQLGGTEPARAMANRAWDDLLGSSLLLAPGFRRAVLARLDDRAPYGTVRPSGAGQWHVQARSGFQSYESRHEGDPREPTAPAPVAFRFGDFIAWRVSQVEGCPPFALCWPEADRDAAFKAIRAYFDRFGPQLVADDPGPRPRRWTTGTPAAPFPSFPPLDRPATAADVAEGRALFTLEPPDGPPADRRVVPLPARPLAALWEPPRPVRKRGEPPPPPVPFTERTGRIWQAEEALEGGQWRRYLGVALPHGFARIPAEEVDLTGAFDFDPDGPAGGIRGRDPAHLSPPDSPPWPENQPRESIPFARGAPVVVPIRLRNPTGLDAAVPAESFRRQAGRVVGVERRLYLALRWEPHPTRDESGQLRFDQRAGRSVDLRAGIARFDAAGPTTTLGPAGSLGPEAVDLRDLYPLDRPGRYDFRMSVIGPPTRTPTGGVTTRRVADTQTIAFEVAEPPPGPP